MGFGALLLIFASLHAGGQGLLQNLDFDSSGGWTVDDSSTWIHNGNSSNPAHSGTKFLMVAVRTTDSVASQSTPASPGQQWTLSGFSKEYSASPIEYAAAYVSIDFLGPEGNLGHSQLEVPVTSSWTHFNLSSGIAPAGTTTVLFSAYTLGSNEGYGMQQFDTFSVTAVPEISTTALLAACFLGVVGMGRTFMRDRPRSN